MIFGANDNGDDRHPPCYGQHFSPGSPHPLNSWTRPFSRSGGRSTFSNLHLYFSLARFAVYFGLFSKKKFRISVKLAFRHRGNATQLSEMKGGEAK